MLVFRYFSIITAASLTLLAGAPARADEPRPIPKGIDLSGKTRDVFGVESSILNVFFFVRTDCPISNRYAPELERLQREFAPRGVAFWLVYPDADETAASIETHRREYRLSLPALRDPEHRLVDFAEAKATPEAALFSKDGSELYHGRIDNRFVDLGQERPEPTVRDLESAITNALEGKPITKAETPAVGCILEKPE